MMDFLRQVGEVYACSGQRSGFSLGFQSHRCSRRLLQLPSNRSGLIQPLPNVGRTPCLGTMQSFTTFSLSEVFLFTP